MDTGPAIEDSTSLSPLEIEREVPLSTNRKIFRAAVVIAFISLFAKVGATGKELVVARWFGRGDALEAYLIAFVLPSFVVSLIAGSFNAALIPTYIQVRESEGREAAQRLISSVMFCSLGLLTIIAILLGLSAPYYLPLLGSGFGAVKLLLTRQLFYLLLPFVILNGFVVTSAAILNAGENFALPALTPLFTPLVTLAMLLLTGKNLGVFSLALGTLFGTSLEALLLGWKLKSQGISIMPRWLGMNLHVRQVTGQYLPLVAGVFLMGGTGLIDQSMAAMLEKGSVAALNYGNRIINVFSGIASAAIATAVLPYFSQMVARQDWAGVRHTLKIYGGLITVAASLVTLALCLFSHTIVRILFQRGSFTAADTQVVSKVVAMYSLQIPFYMVGALAVRLVSALKKNSILLVVAGCSLVLDVVLNYVFMKWMGVAGIGLSTSVVYLISLILIFSAIWPVFQKLGPVGGDRP